MAAPIGENNWLAYLEEAVRNATNLENRITAVEHFKRAVGAEPHSLHIWLSYCEYFWTLWEATQASTSDDWSDEERLMGRELFSFEDALDLWQRGYEAVQYRLGDSHMLWNRWISLELDLLSKSRTPEGIKRITHLYRDRLLTPHITWDETSQNYSSFLSEYNRPTWEDAMKQITANAQETKRLVAARDPFELKLKNAASSADSEAHKAALKEYLEWEMIESKRSNDDLGIGIKLCQGLYARALTGLLATDQTTWYEYIVFLSSSNSDPQAPGNLLDILRQSVQHCPWSGLLWNRYILCAEEAKLPFAEIESIKHAATSEDQLLKDGMEGMIEMYVGWCGFLKRTAMDATATDEAVDVADVGLSAALEDVAVVGQRLYGKDFQGDPKFRLERIYIQYLTEKKGAIDEARAQWNKLAALPIHADNHDFWFRYYMWEMLIFSSSVQENRSPTPSSVSASFRIPSFATAVLLRAVTRQTIDWPEKVLEVYMQHCNDYEPPLYVRKAADRVHKTAKAVQRRRERETQEKAAAYAAYYENQEVENSMQEADSLSASKRKRDTDSVNGDETENAIKRHKGDSNDAMLQQAAPAQTSRRDRENSTILVTNLPGEVTQIKLRQYFKEYGHINNITALVQENDGTSATALIEFKTAEEARSALLRDGKYFGQSQISVESGYNLTIYVTNYPPAAGEKFIRDLFKDCGEILSLRWPSLQKNTHRRFCYISFRSQMASAKAVEKDGSLLENRFKLVVKYSDPAQKKTREGAIVEGREVYVGNLDRSVSESDLKAAFSKYGTVTRVNIPQNLAGKNKGFAFIDFQTKEEAAKAAEELNNTKFRSQILKVEISKDSKFKPTSRTVVNKRDSASPAPTSICDGEGDASMRDAPGAVQNKPTADDVAARTIALMGLPDTVNDAWVRALVEPLGSITDIVLQPAHGGAKIEFMDAATAGKMMLRLSGMEHEGYKLRTGTVDELRRAKPVRQEDRIVYGSKDQKHKDQKSKDSVSRLAPLHTTIRRPTLGKPGLKRGLGFSRPATSSVSKSSVESNGTPIKKSNADFKALFLTSGKDGNRKQDENTSESSKKQGKLEER